MTEEVYRGALLWLRNHYDVGAPKLKVAVLGRIDALLNERPPKMTDIEAFDRTFPPDPHLYDGLK